jgi:hypothetical protein
VYVPNYLDRQTWEDLPDIDHSSATHPAASLRIIAPLVDSGQPMFGRAIDYQPPLLGWKVSAATHHSALRFCSDGFTHCGTCRFRLGKADLMQAPEVDKSGVANC